MRVDGEAGATMGVERAPWSVIANMAEASQLRRPGAMFVESASPLKILHQPKQAGVAAESGRVEMGSRGEPEAPAWPVPASPARLAEPSLEVLSRRHQERFAVDLPESS